MIKKKKEQKIIYLLKNHLITLKDVKHQTLRICLIAVNNPINIKYLTSDYAEVQIKIFKRWNTHFKYIKNQLPATRQYILKHTPDFITHLTNPTIEEWKQAITILPGCISKCKEQTKELCEHAVSIDPYYIWNCNIITENMLITLIRRKPIYIIELDLIKHLHLLSLDNIIKYEKTLRNLNHELRKLSPKKMYKKFKKLTI